MKTNRISACVAGHTQTLARALTHHLPHQAFRWATLVVLAALGFQSQPVQAADDPGIRFLLTTAAVFETDPVARLQVLRASDADHPVTVDFFTEATNLAVDEFYRATPGEDYTAVSNRLTFQPGEHFKLIEIPILNDGFRENSETFRVVLINASEGVIPIPWSIATVTIRDNDPGFSFESTLFGPSEIQGEVALNVTRGADGPGRISVDYSIEPDNASPGLDFISGNGTLFFEASNSVQTIRVPILPDTLYEPNETFRVLLSNPSSGASLGAPSTATIRIFDNDPGFRFGASTYAIDESGGEVILYVNRATDAPGEMSVDYAVELITAAAGADYTPVNGRLVFAAADSSLMIRVPIIEDTLKEPTETFRVVLSNPSSGAFVGTLTSATVRITDNDPGFSFYTGSSYTVSEEEGQFLLFVNRGTTDASVETSVDYAVEPVSATADLDYTSLKGTLVFGVDEFSKAIQIPILNDAAKEPTETFRVALSNPSNGTSLGSPILATVRILDNDPGIRFLLTTAAVFETDPVARLQVLRAGDADHPVAVDFFTEATNLAVDELYRATPGEDYTSVSNRLTFQPGEHFKLIEIPILNDGFRENSETFRVVLTNASEGVIPIPWSIATVTIRDNDPGFSFESTLFGPSEIQGEVALNVTRGADGPGRISVDYSIEPGTATPGLDYTPVNGTLLFGAQEAFKTIRVPILNDSLAEPPETFSVVLSNPSSGAFLGAITNASVTIQDNELNELGFAFEPRSGEISENTGEAKIDVVLLGDFELTNSVSVDFATMPGSATADVDYLSQSGTLIFAPGETRKTISIPLLHDGLFENAETFGVILRNPAGLSLSVPNVFTFTINDNERGYSIERSPGQGAFFPEIRLVVRENSGDTLVNIYREGDFNFTSSVDFRAHADAGSGSTATAGKDFVAASGTVVFGPGETNKTIAIHLVDDHLIEFGERFIIELSNPTGGISIVEPQRWVEIQNEERNPLRVDPDFNAAVHYARGPGFDESDGNLQVLPDGRIVMATPLWRLTGEDGVGIVRLLPNGSLDPTFQMASVSTRLQTLAVQTNGQVLVGGGADLWGINGQPVPQLARLNADGSLDSQYVARLPKPAVVLALAAQQDGKSLVATDNGGLVRLNSDGSVDPSFQPLLVNGLNGVIQRINLDKKNRALIWGAFSGVNRLSRPGLARLLPDGSLDNSVLATWNFGPIQYFALEDEDSVLIRFTNSDGLNTVARLTEEGSVDPNFKPSGNVSSGASVNLIAAAPRGRVLVSTTTTAQYGSGLVSNLNPDGSSDESLPDGTYTVTFPSAGGWDSHYSLTPEPSGNLLVKGDVLAVNGQRGPGLVRLLVDAPTPRIDMSSANVVETNGLVDIKLIRTGDISGPFTVNWATDGGTAQPGLDFVAAGGSVTFGVGESDHSISLRLLDNALPDGDRTVRLRVTTPNGASLPAASFTILNDDLGFVPGGSFAFPNGRFLMNVTGNFTHTNVRIEISNDLLGWGEWRQMPNDSQVIIDAFSDKQLFHRLVSE